jgi:hypothetical protein
MGVVVIRREDRGEANALGMVLIAPLAVALAVLILWVGRKVDTDAQVQAASSAAAQAAVLQRTPEAAMAAARSTAAAMLTDWKACQGSALVAVDTSDFHPGGVVTVAVSCAPQRSDLGLARADAVTVAATATATIDSHRAVGLP